MKPHFLTVLFLRGALSAIVLLLAAVGAVEAQVAPPTGKPAPAAIQPAEIQPAEIQTADHHTGVGAPAPQNLSDPNNQIGSPAGDASAAADESGASSSPDQQATIQRHRTADRVHLQIVRGAFRIEIPLISMSDANSAKRPLTRQAARATTGATRAYSIPPRSSNQVGGMRKDQAYDPIMRPRDPNFSNK